MPYSRLHGGGGCLKAEHILFGEPAIRSVLCKHKTKEVCRIEQSIQTQALQLAEEAGECRLARQC